MIKLSLDSLRHDSAVLRTLPFGIQKSELPKDIFPPRNRLCELCEGIIKKDGA